MAFTKTERLLLINQYQILAKLDKSMAADHERMIDALESGYSSHYNALLHNMGEELSRADQTFVIDVMSMHDAMQRVTEKSALPDVDVTFHGFDGNNETEFLGYARFVVEKEQRYSYLKIGHDLNSHMELVPRYRKQVARWTEWSKSMTLSEAQVRELAGITGWN